LYFSSKCKAIRNQIKEIAVKYYRADLKKYIEDAPNDSMSIILEYKIFKAYNELVEEYTYRVKYRDGEKSRFPV
jgi:hypothetical protein